MPKQEVPPDNQRTKKLIGTFSYPPPMCIGEMYMNARDRGGKDARSKGKQIQSGQMAGTVACPGHFSAPTFLCSDGKLPYTENIKFKDVFKDKPEKKKLGFLTSDFPKREEFSNQVDVHGHGGSWGHTSAAVESAHLHLAAAKPAASRRTGADVTVCDEIEMYA